MAKWEVPRRALLAGAAAVAAAAAVRAQGPVEARPAVPVGVTPVDISARPITSFLRTSSAKSFGPLTFRGGLALTSSVRDFGGLSGLVVDPTGRGLVAVTDAGHWLTAGLTYTGTAPAGLAQARMGPLLARNGRPITRKREGDAEAIALVEGNLERGTVLVAFEHAHRIARHPIMERMLQAPTSFLKMPPDARQMKTNKGLEALTVMAGGPLKGAVIAIAEQFPTPDGSHVGWLWIGDEPRRFGLTDIGGFEPTDCASLPDGSLILLERRFRWSEGVKMRLRRFAPGDIAPGRTAAGTTLLEADITADIDNMEGLAIHRDPGGATVLTLVSDDNFNGFLQRTLLLQFTLA